MSGTVTVPRGDESRFVFATLASAFLVVVCAACSGEVEASGSANSGRFESFDPETSASWEELIAHSQRVAPTPAWDGALDGLKTLWYDDGMKKSEGRFVQGRKEGAWTFWYENGRKRWEGTYHLDLVEGPEQSWYRDGGLCYSGVSASGNRHGTFRAWHENGQPWWEGEYWAGVRQGIFRYWQRDGSPDTRVSGLYVDGKRVKGLDENGQSRIE